MSFAQGASRAQLRHLVTGRRMMSSVRDKLNEMGQNMPSGPSNGGSILTALAG